MPLKPLKLCNKIGCNALTRERYCERHQALPIKDNRPSAHQRGYNTHWQKTRVAYLSEHPWCAECQRKDKRTPATEVDHIVPHKGDMNLFWDEDNWQGLCHSCHSRKTASENGGFGNHPSPPNRENSR